LIVDPTRAFCPTDACPARGQAGRGNVRVHSRIERRFRCLQCRKTFALTAGTPFYRLRTPAETVTLVVTLLAHGCPPLAVVAAFGLDERTVADWLARSGAHGRGVHEHLVERPRPLGQVQADEIRVRMQGGIGWMAMAMAVGTRLWLGGEVSARRDWGLIRRLMGRVRRCALAGWILVCTDGLSTYVRATREAFTDRPRTGATGRPAKRVWPGLLMAQVIKRYERRRLTEIERRVVMGTPEQVEREREASSGEGVINTAFIERIIGTFRQRLAPLARRTRGPARTTGRLEAGMWLVGAVYNFCSPHASLREEGPGGGRTPAMAAGITERIWSVGELLAFRVPPPRWAPPTRRGRVSRATRALVEQWCQ
jgi:transposase-like protein